MDPGLNSEYPFSEPREKIISWDMKKNILGGAIQIFFVGEMTAKLVDENGEMYLIHMDTLEMTRISR